MSRKTVLAFGATGMLRGALDVLAQEAERAIVVARRASTAHATNPVQCPDVVPIDLDWHDPAAIQALEPHLGEGVDLALVWIHSSATDLWSDLLTRLVRRPCTVVQVLGNRGEPAELKQRVEALEPVAGFRYLTVKLGAKRDGATWRWLTHQEISEGALSAIGQLRDVYVGTQPPTGL